jgi:hypothetical protein
VALAKAHADAGLGREHIRPFVDANCSKGRRGFGTRATKKNLAQKKPSWENTLTYAIMGGAKETFVLLVIDLEHTGHGSYYSDIRGTWPTGVVESRDLRKLKVDFRQAFTQSRKSFCIAV